MFSEDIIRLIFEYLPPRLYDVEVGSCPSMKAISNYIENWQSIAEEQWGCKWDVYNVSASRPISEKDSLEYLFDTPMSPPIRWLDKALLKYPKLYCVPICGFTNSVLGNQRSVGNDTEDIEAKCMYW